MGTIATSSASELAASRALWRASELSSALAPDAAANEAARGDRARVNVVVIVDVDEGDDTKEFRVGERAPKVRASSIRGGKRPLDNWGVLLDDPTSFGLLRPRSGPLAVSTISRSRTESLGWSASNNRKITTIVIRISLAMACSDDTLGREGITPRLPVPCLEP
jgi:hypothetical protein